MPCVGYGFIEIKEKLKAIYSHLTSKEIGDLKRDGTVITEPVTNHFFCFLGDTSKAILNNTAIYKYTYLMIQRTFLPIFDEADSTEMMKA